MHVTALGNKPIPHGISTAPAHRIHYTTPRTSHRDRMSGEREADKGCNSGGQEKKVIGLSRKQLKAHETNGTAHRTPQCKPLLEKRAVLFIHEYTYGIVGAVHGSDCI